MEVNITRREMVRVEYAQGECVLLWRGLGQQTRSPAQPVSRAARNIEGQRAAGVVSVCEGTWCGVPYAVCARLMRCLAPVTCQLIYQLEYCLQGSSFVVGAAARLGHTDNMIALRLFGMM